MKKLSEKKKQILKDFVDGKCEICKNKSEKLNIHRIKRGADYQNLRNLMVICNDCHKKIHSMEFK